MKNVIVTGASKRIGKSIAETLARNGWSVAVHYRDSADDAEAVVAEIGRGAVAVQADLTDEGQVRRMFADAQEALSGIAAVVNNASVFKVDDAMTEDPTLWNEHMAAHARAPFVLSQCLAKN